MPSTRDIRRRIKSVKNTSQITKAMQMVASSKMRKAQQAALAGRPNVPFDVPSGVSFADIDSDTGKLALPGCPRTITESFLAGTEPTDFCELHRESVPAISDR